MDWLSRTELLLGEERLGLLKKAHVLVAGLGGVGAYAAEQLCRAGVGEMTIIDGDCVDVTIKTVNFRRWIVISVKQKPRSWRPGFGI